jgi:hypothetical protein
VYAAQFSNKGFLAKGLLSMTACRGMHLLEVDEDATLEGGGHLGARQQGKPARKVPEEGEGVVEGESGRQTGGEHEGVLVEVCSEVAVVVQDAAGSSNCVHLGVDYMPVLLVQHSCIVQIIC